MNRVILASSNDDTYEKIWLKTMMKKSDKKTIFHSYYTTRDFSYIGEYARTYDKHNPPLTYYLFMQEPTLINAKKLIADLVFNKSTKQFNTAPKRNSRKACQSIQVHGGASIFDKVSVGDMYELLGRIDFLHDMKDIYRKQEDMRKMRLNFAKRLGVTEKIAEMFSAYTEGFTKEFMKTLVTQDKAFTENEKVYSLKSKGKNDPLFIPDVYDIFEDEEEIVIVMDSLIWRKDSSKNVQNGFMAAFLLLALNNVQDTYDSAGMYKLDGKKTKSIRKITFLDGDFMSVDGMPLIHFCTKFITEVAKITNAEVRVESITGYKPTAFINTIADVTIKDNKLTITPLDGKPPLSVRFYQAFNKRGEWMSHKPNEIPKRESNIHTFIKNLQDSWVIPYTKSTLMELMTVLDEYKEKEATEVIQTMANLNFLRDSWRVEIAIEHDAYLLTSDILSYRLLQKMAGNGFCFHITKYDKVDGNTFVFGVDIHANK